MIVPDLNLMIPSGCLFGLIGPSGSGKTTIMRAMLGLGAVHAGEMSMLGLPAGSPRLRENIGYLPQNGGAWLDLTARECLRFTARIYRTNPARIDEVLALLELQDIADRTLSTLSGGQERRVGLAMAILHEPRVLVLDEPTVGLDPRLRHKLWRAFRNWTDAGTSILVSTHVMAEAEECDLVAVLHSGRVIAVETPADLVRREHATNLEDAVLRLFEQEANHVG